MFGIFTFGEGYFGQPEPEEKQLLEQPICDWPTLQRLLGRRKKKLRVPVLQPPQLEPEPKDQPITEEDIAEVFEALETLDKLDQADLIAAGKRVAEELAIDAAFERHVMQCAFRVLRRRQAAAISKALARVEEQQQDLSELNEALTEASRELVAD